MKIGNILKFVFDSMINRCFFTLCIIVMGIVGFSMTNEVVMENYRMNSLYIGLKQLYNNENLYLIQFNTYQISDYVEERFEKACEEIRELNGIDWIGEYTYGGNRYVNNNKIIQTRNLRVDEGVIYAREIELIEGDLKAFTKTADGVVPVLIGYDLKKDFKIGDVFTDESNECTYKVVGIMGKGNLWFLPNGIVEGNPNAESLDEVIVEINSQKNGFVGWNSSFVGMSDKKNAVNTVNEAKIIMSKYGISVDIITADKAIDNLREESKEQLTLYMMMMILFLMITIIGISSTAAVTVIMKKQDYGIMQAIGIGSRDIVCMIYIENLIKVMVSAIIAYYYSSGKVKVISEFTFDESLYLMYKNVYIWILLGIVLLISVISTIVPCILFKRQKVSQMIGGEKR